MSTVEVLAYAAGPGAVILATALLSLLLELYPRFSYRLTPKAKQIVVGLCSAVIAAGAVGLQHVLGYQPSPTEALVNALVQVFLALGGSQLIHNVNRTWK